MRTDEWTKLEEGGLQGGGWGMPQKGMVSGSWFFFSPLFLRVRSSRYHSLLPL